MKFYFKNQEKEFLENFGDKFYIFGLDDWIFTEEFSTEKLIKHFNTNSLKGFGVDGLAEGTIAAGAVLHYLSETNHERVQHISALSRIEEDKYVWLDRFTIRNLELFGSANENARTLTDVIDRTVSPMGARLLKRWLALPLKDITPINERLDGVQALLDRSELRDALIELIKPIGDLERLVAKAAAGRINPRELMVLRRALDAIGPIQTLCLSSGNIQLEKIAAVLDSCSIIRDRIAKDLHPEPPMLVHKGSVIADGVDLDLDELRHLAFSGKDYLLKLQHRESESTKIPSLKVAFNNVFGYYLEVSNAHKDKVPLEWIRKQTLVNAERYITPELKTYEEKILGAEEKFWQLSRDFCRACTFIRRMDCSHTTKCCNTWKIRLPDWFCETC